MPQQWKPASHITVFIRNLRLLDLHNRPDAPETITADIFANSSLQPRATRRHIKVVEWALYNLLLIYDPSEATQGKLRPHYPPLETRQSMNLRAALLKVLSDLKKDGALDKNIVLWRTVLDECRGEKVEGLLAVVSTMVLKRVLSRKPQFRAQLQLQGNINEVLRIALCDHLSSAADQEKLVPMILAHCSSLHAIPIERKELADANARAKNLLNQKDAQVSLKEHRYQSPHLTEELDFRDAEIARQSFLHSWKGKDVWAETFVNGGLSAGTDEILDSTFEDVWGQVRNAAPQTTPLSSFSPPSPSSHGLAQNLVMELNNRLLEHQSRLQYWKDFRCSLVSPPHKAVDSIKHREKTTVFRRHQDLHVNAIAKPSSTSTRSSVPRGNHASLISSLDEALLRNGSTTRDRELLNPNKAPAKGARAHLASQVSPPVSPPSHRLMSDLATPSHTTPPDRFPILSSSSASRLESPGSGGAVSMHGLTDDDGGAKHIPTITRWEDQDLSSVGITNSSPSVTQKSSDWEDIDDNLSASNVGNSNDAIISPLVMTPLEGRLRADIDSNDRKPTFLSPSPSASPLGIRAGGGEMTLSTTAPQENAVKGSYPPDNGRLSTPRVINEGSFSDEWRDGGWIDPETTPSKKNNHLSPEPFQSASSSSSLPFARRISTAPRPLPLAEKDQNINVPSPDRQSSSPTPPPPLTPREELFSQTADYAAFSKVVQS